MSRHKKRNEGGIPSSLRNICLDNFLDILETTCSAFVQLSLIDSPYLRKMVKNFLPSLKHHIDMQLPGNVMRKEMLDVIFSGKFPTNKSRKDFELDSKVDPGSQEYLDHVEIIKKVKKNSENCSGICCSGWFVVETMACVLINDRANELVFNFDFCKMMGQRDNKEDLCNFLSFDVPSIMENYFTSVKEKYFSMKLKPQLEKMIISPKDLNTKGFGNRNDLLQSFEETKAYLNFPRLLSSASSKPNNSKSTTPCIEDLFVVMTDGFSLGQDTFENLHTIELTFESMRNNFQDYVANDAMMFANIGKSCPNLKNLTAQMSPDALFYLLFKDPCKSIKGFSNTPDVQVQILDDRLYDRVKEGKEYTEEDIYVEVLKS